MYVCMYVCMPTISKCMYVFIYMWRYCMNEYTCVYVHINVCMYIFIYRSKNMYGMYLFIDLCMYVCMYVGLFVLINLCMFQSYQDFFNVWYKQGIHFYNNQTTRFPVCYVPSDSVSTLAVNPNLNEEMKRPKKKTKYELSICATVFSIDSAEMVEWLVCMYVCMYVCICIAQSFIYVCMYVCMYVSCMDDCMWTLVHEFMFRRSKYVCTVCVYVSCMDGRMAGMYVRMYVCLCIAQSFINVCMYVCIMYDKLHVNVRVWIHVS